MAVRVEDLRPRIEGGFRHRKAILEAKPKASPFSPPVTPNFEPESKLFKLESVDKGIEVLGRVVGRRFDKETRALNGSPMVEITEYIQTPSEQEDPHHQDHVYSLGVAQKGLGGQYEVIRSSSITLKKARSTKFSSKLETQAVQPKKEQTHTGEPASQPQPPLWRQRGEIPQEFR